MEATQPDVVVIGAGIVGLATALALTERGARVTVVDKENQVAAHQTGHNSGVIHTGIYYKPGSHKAKLCVDGRARLLQFCQQEGIPTKTPGKVVVATSDSQIPALDELHRRAEANGVEAVRRIDPTQLRALEPNATGVVALHVPGAGTVDFRQVAAAMQRRLLTAGGQVQTGVEVKSASRTGSLWTLKLDGTGVVKAPLVVACAGLQSDRVARLLGLNPQVRIVPFRGEYWHLQRPDLVNGLIYPVPDPQFPFLGVHFTKGIDGAVEVGPNAVLAFAREGYSWSRIVPGELREILATPGLAKLARRYWKTGAGEVARSLIPALQIRAARQLVP
ncbi:MAG: L-2-hydroxyglutarate oxidase, partial [Acidimicrobiia bacterium]